MKKFITEIFSEDNGKASFARVTTFLILMSELSWITYLILKNNALPDLAGLTLFLVALYGANKAAAAVSDFSNKN